MRLKYDPSSEPLRIPVKYSNICGDLSAQDGYTLYPKAIPHTMKPLNPSNPKTQEFSNLETHLSAKQQKAPAKR
jgi:hypothetical protein